MKTLHWLAAFALVTIFLAATGYHQRADEAVARQEQAQRQANAREWAHIKEVEDRIAYRFGTE